MIPNVTQIPNKLFDEELAKMKETELKIVLLVARKTLGWILDPTTGMRKKEDWISNGQLSKLTGKSKDAVSRSLKSCVNNKWIEARTQNGDLVTDPQQRRRLGRGSRIYYRLGDAFMVEDDKTHRTINKDLVKKSYFVNKDGLKEYKELKTKNGFR